MEAVAAGANVISFCRPMKILPENWNVVESPQQMFEAVLHQVGRPFVQRNYKSMYDIDDTAKEVIGLFDQPED